MRKGGIEAELGLKIFSFAPAARRDFERFFKRWKLLRPDRAPRIVRPRKFCARAQKFLSLPAIRISFIARLRRKPFRLRIFFRPRFCKIDAFRCGAAFAYPREKMSADFQREFALENSAVFPIRLPF